jgi:hypothetical protein
MLKHGASDEAVKGAGALGVPVQVHRIRAERAIPQPCIRIGRVGRGGDVGTRRVLAAGDHLEAHGRQFSRALRALIDHGAVSPRRGGFRKQANELIFAPKGGPFPHPQRLA